NYLHFFFFQAEDGIRDRNVTGVQTCALPIFLLDADDHPLAPARVPNARAHAKRQIVAERLAEGRVRLAHDPAARFRPRVERRQVDRKSTRLNSSHVSISYAVFCLKKKTKTYRSTAPRLERAPARELCQSGVPPFAELVVPRARFLRAGARTLPGAATYTFRSARSL